MSKTTILGIAGVLVLGTAVIAYLSFHREDHDQTVVSKQGPMKSGEQRAAEPQTTGVPPAATEKLPKAFAKRFQKGKTKTPPKMSVIDRAIC